MASSGLEASKASAGRTQLEQDGFLLLKDAVPRAPLRELSQLLLESYREQAARGALFQGGGSVSGHLNCFPGAASRFVWQALESNGVFDFVRSLSTTPLRLPNVGCNLNLPGSAPQNEHVDGYARAPFLIVNVAAVDTNVLNGAMEVMVGSHLRTSKYWQIALSQRNRRRPIMSQGDALVRFSTLWHRGMPNRSIEPRPMLAFTWEDGGSREDDPYLVHGGRITFLPNRFRTDWKGRLSERAFVKAPRLGRAYCIARSLLE